MGIVILVINAVIGFVIVDAVLSWVQAPNQVPRRYTHMITSVLYAPIQAILPPQKLGGLDISPLVIIVALQWIRGML